MVTRLLLNLIRLETAHVTLCNYDSMLKVECYRLAALSPTLFGGRYVTIV